MILLLLLEYGIRGPAGLSLRVFSLICSELKVLQEKFADDTTTQPFVISWSAVRIRPVAPENFLTS
jgi:hypothetical protein